VIMKGGSCPFRLMATRWLRISIVHATSWIQERVIVKAAKSGKRFRSSSKQEAVSETESVVLGMNCTKGSNASCSMAWYLRRS
jgi:hypothetical protein